MQKTNVLFLSSENATRSQIGEALLRHYAPDHFEVFSAGIEPPTTIHPLTRQVLEEMGLGLGSQRSKDVREYLGFMHFGYLITVSHRAEANFPKTFLGVGRRMYWQIVNPVIAGDSDEAQVVRFREVRDQIDMHLRQWLSALGITPVPLPNEEHEKSHAIHLASPRPTLDQELAALQDNLLHMGSRLDAAIERALQALVNRDLTLAHQVIAADEQINTLRYEIEEACSITLATQAPTARDLRAVMAAFSIASDLERMADHAAGIATIVVRLGTEPLLKPLIDIPRMAEAAREMLRRALTGYIARDITQARAVAQMDDVIDNLYQQIFRELLTFMLEDPHTISRALPLLFVAHNLERIGDRAVNIAERTVFISSGELKEFKTSTDNGQSSDR